MTQSVPAPSPAVTAPMRNDALTPIPMGDRVFSFGDHASLWFSLGVGLLVMQVGAYLMPALGTREAFVAIIAGSVIGAGLLAWVAKLGCESGLSSAGLMHAVYGSAFSRLPVLLNIVQLLGWGAFEIVVMRDATVAIAQQGGAQVMPWWTPVATLLWGGVIALLINGSMVAVVRRVVSRIGLPLVILSLVWLTWQFVSLAQAKGWSELWLRKGDGGMGVLPALDLVIAMPISWLPLVADYARHGRDGKSALKGTWLGYAIANIWCYSLGVLVALTLPSENLVNALLLAQGGLLALSLILVDEVDNAYGDAYSGSVSAHSMLPRWTVRQWGVAMTLACTLFAVALPMHSLEPFLLLLSSVFVPLFGVMLGRLGGATRANALRLDEAPKARAVPITIWIGGIAIYHLCSKFAPEAGAALPALAATLALGWLTRSR